MNLDPTITRLMRLSWPFYSYILFMFLPPYFSLCSWSACSLVSRSLGGSKVDVAYSAGLGTQLVWPKLLSKLWVHIHGSTKLWVFFALSALGLIHPSLKKMVDAQTHFIVGEVPVLVCSLEGRGMGTPEGVSLKGVPKHHEYGTSPGVNNSLLISWFVKKKYF